ADVRERCPALKQLLAPDEVWELIVANSTEPLDDALHCSCLAKAYHHGNLGRLTGPIHQFLLTGPDVDARLTKQYRQDLRERWLAETSERSRHEEFRRFLGKIVELQVASWLADHQWNVTGLEALGERVDIAASSPENIPHAIEVKY